jgi:hypothetical protein
MIHRNSLLETLIKIRLKYRHENQKTGNKSKKNTGGLLPPGAEGRRGFP